LQKAQEQLKTHAAAADEANKRQQKAEKAGKGSHPKF